MTRRTLTREEIDEQDFNNLVGSGSEDEGDDNEERTAASGSKKSKKDRSKDLRALLFNNDEEDDDVWGKAGTAWKEELAEVRGQGKGKGKANGDMEITFKPALSGSKILDSGADEENMTTLERYQMRMKEKKARKKEKRELRRAGKDDSAEEEEDEDEKPVKGKPKKADDFFGDSSDDEDEPAPPPTKRSAAKEKEKPLPAAPIPAKEDDLPAELQMATDHFSMKDILRAEKEKGKRKRRRTKKGGKHEDEREVELGPDGWKVNVQDDRFKVLHEEPEFAIDPSNPAYVLILVLFRVRGERIIAEAVQVYQDARNEGSAGGASTYTCREAASRTCRQASVQAGRRTRREGSQLFGQQRQAQAGRPAKDPQAVAKVVYQSGHLTVSRGCHSSFRACMHYVRCDMRYEL